MDIDLSKIKKTHNIRPPRIICYGPHGIGKSTLGASLPKPLFLDIEQGLDAIDCFRHPIKTYDDLQYILMALMTQEHNFQSIVLDSLDALEQIFFAKVCNDHDKNSIEEIGYGKGYIFALSYWHEFLETLNFLRDEKNMNILLIAHEQIKRYDDPRTESYDRYQLKLHDKAGAKLQEWCDILMFAGYDVKIATEETGFNAKKNKGKGGRRTLYFTESPALLAKNRYALPEEKMPFDNPFPWDALLAYIKGDVKTEETETENKKGK